jgi:hypothetical protein
MKIFKTVVVVLGLFIGQALADEQNVQQRDECTLRGLVAYTAILSKRVGANLDETKNAFMAWLTPDYRDQGKRFSGLTIQEANLVVSWYNMWGGESMERWFGYVYDKYDNPEVAFKEQHAACVQTNNRSPLASDLK